MPGTVWTPEDKRRLEDMVRSGLGPVAIQRCGALTATANGPRSLHAIAQQIRRMHLASPALSERARRARIRGRSLTEEQRRRTEEYLKSQGQNVPIRHVVQRFGVTESWVRRALKRLGIQRTWTESVAHPLSRFHDPDYRRSVSERVKNWAANRSESRRQQFNLRCEQVRAEHPGQELRRCDECRGEWPLTGEFFAAYPRPAAGRTYFLHLCRLCAAARRRQHEPVSQRELQEGLRSRRMRRELAAQRDQVRATPAAAPERACRACWENWPLLPLFWRSSRTKTGKVVFDPRCRICENARRRSAAKSRAARERFAQSLGTVA